MSSRSYIRSQKSWNEVKMPFFSRSSTNCFINERPTPLTAARPKRMSLSATEKLSYDRFTSGGCTEIPISRAVWIYSEIFSETSSTLVSSAAMYSRG